ncbi:hypothetical protein, partial [Phocaeicola plebeius]|uniref:hypothetical protein n=1 Tax=Phocaeicola plebeius TaxID=310297 RepID=UPI001C703370
MNYSPTDGFIKEKSNFVGKRITDWSLGTKSGCAMNRPEIIHEMNKFFLILFVLTASILSVALWG